MIIVNYEVYVLEQPRGWMLHARFPRQERETAISEAKELEQTLNVRVKVVRETYYTDDNVFEEAEVYISGMKGAGERRPPPPSPNRSAAKPSRTAAKPPPRKQAQSRKPAPKTEAPQSFDEDPRPRRKKAAKAHHLVGRLLAITAVALAAALLSIKVTPNAIMLLWDFGFRIDLNPNAYGQLLFAVFVLVFLMTAVPLAIRFLPRQTEIPGFKRPTLSWRGAHPVNKELKKSLDKLANQAIRDDMMNGTLPEEPEPVQPDPLPEDEALPEIKPDPDDLLAEMEEKRKWEEEATAPAEPEIELPPVEAAPAEEPPPAKPEEPSSGGTSAPEAQVTTVNRFLNGAVNAVKSAVPVLDSYNKFALHLYMAGGVESLCDVRNVADGGKVKLTVSALETLGTKGDLARKFHEKLPEYILEPRYLGVVQAGRDAMGDFLDGNEATAHIKIKEVMREWNKPAEKKGSIVTVMFTDMVGSTDLTQAVGDRAAQEIVRRHNSIVRGALAQFGGKEVKHTGDGIMASFSSAAGAVEATINIQRQVIAGNKRSPDLELHLRIGLNAGEPIEEEDDLFGTTVQLAARVCAAAGTDQILCTGVVKDLSFGKGGSFKPMGEKVLKGFRDPISLHEIVWTE